MWLLDGAQTHRIPLICKVFNGKNKFFELVPTHSHKVYVGNLRITSVFCHLGAFYVQFAH